MKIALIVYITLIHLAWAYAYLKYPQVVKKLSVHIRAALGHHLENVRQFVKKCAHSHLWMVGVMTMMIWDMFYHADWHDYIAIAFYVIAAYPLTSGAIYSIRAAHDLDGDSDRINRVLNGFFRDD